MKQLIIISLLFSFSSVAQSEKDTNKLVIGIEQDILPYFLKGFIGTVWLGKNKSRYRLSYAQATSPKFFVGKDVSSDRVKALGLSYEYFFKENFNGLWVGPGLGYWQNDIALNNGVNITNNSFILTLGGGYNIKLKDWLYVSPWLALHTRLTGTNKVNILYETYKPAVFTPEASFKIGVKF